MTQDEINLVEKRQRPGARKRARLLQTPVMLGKPLRDDLDALAQAQGQSRSAVIRDAVKDYLRRNAKRAH